MVIPGSIGEYFSSGIVINLMFTGPVSDAHYEGPFDLIVKQKEKLKLKVELNLKGSLMIRQRLVIE